MFRTSKDKKGDKLVNVDTCLKLCMDSRGRVYTQVGTHRAQLRARILGRNWDKSLRKFPPAIHSQFY